MLGHDICLLLSCGHVARSQGFVQDVSPNKLWLSIHNYENNFELLKMHFLQC